MAAATDDPLKNVKIASPCSADWNAMKGDERKRFCGECKLNVYNLSGMTQYDAENLLRNSEGRVCVRFYRRADGTVLTQDCPVGWARVKQRTALMAAAAGSLALMLLSVVFHLAAFGRRGDLAYRFPIRPLTTPTPKPEPLMGAIAVPKPTPKPKATPKSKEGLPQDIEVLMGEVAPQPVRKKGAF